MKQTTLDPIDRERLQKLITSLGEAPVAAKLEVHRLTVARAAAGFRLRRSTAKLLRLGMQEIEAERANV